MASTSANTISALKEHLSQTQVKLYTPDSADYADVESCFVVRPIRTLAVARPQIAEDVVALLRFCVQNNVDFTVRGGGHDCAGRTRAQGALVIDMRDFNYVKVSADKKTARIGGGILFGRLIKELGERGLVTPCGTVPSVGYVGWSTLGGYGPLTARYGLGVDQICGAKIVNAEGEVVDANDDLLVGLRGGGGTLGIILELTIKVYPLVKLLHSTIVYESSNLAAAMFSYAEYYEKLIATGELPAALQLQPMTVEMPNIGMAFAVMASWSGPDEEGRLWIKKIAGAAPLLFEATQSITLLEFLDNNEKLVTWPSYGRTFTVSIKRWTPKTMEILAKYSSTAPGGSLAVSVHSLRSPQPSETSVFGSRLDHHVLEIIALMGDESLQEKREAWALELTNVLKSEDPDNILEGSYVSLGADADTDLEKVYGRHYSTLLKLKQKYDGGNVFKYAVPRLLPLTAGEKN
ncbi:hypothetical protein B0T10DRAFT_541011 [Thelonectria olida]|uniref:FAD-binding PCMH-type domain-containing protein n=1 Tax=Thelonectria olida TaxID=1576542 RepID=A0A9P8VV68_9HYPO|nr:hypothetical protein B0T10DRAFT_541011 [Thelonectria olida]